MFDPSNPLSEGFRAAVATSLTSFLDDREPELADIGPELTEILSRARVFTGGGKRLRPAFCLAGHVAAGGEPSQSVVDLAASLDMLHVSALVHDDVMDNSDTRRGVAAAHRQYQLLHQEADWVGDPAVFGRAGAILLGDLLTMWSVQMADEAFASADLAGLDLTRARGLLQQVRTEVTCGQFLDIIAQAHDPLQVGIEQALDEANRVVEFKTAKYSVQRPVQIGAALAGAGEDVLSPLADYGSWLGRAFQFRDDLLGVFGDEGTTGKPTGGDLREGKRTLLLAMALDQLTESDRAELAGLVGTDLDESGLTRAQELITASRAVNQVEDLITEYLERALATLDDAELTDDGRTALTALAMAATQRDK